MTSSVDQVRYRERLGVPIRWWAQGTMALATLWIAMVVVSDEAPWLAATLAFALITFALLALFLIWYGDARIKVEDGRLRAGRAQIDLSYIGEVTSLDAKQTWQVSGPEADVRAFLLLRPYLKRAVQVEIVDADDPTPYWLLSSRRPDALAQALRAARPATD